MESHDAANPPASCRLHISAATAHTATSQRQRQSWMPGKYQLSINTRRRLLPHAVGSQVMNFTFERFPPITAAWCTTDHNTPGGTRPSTTTHTHTHTEDGRRWSRYGNLHGGDLCSYCTRGSFLKLGAGSKGIGMQMEPQSIYLLTATVMAGKHIIYSNCSFVCLWPLQNGFFVSPAVVEQ